MTTFQVNFLNIVLMFASLVVAIIIPFELFLLSYAILGPLHYLTEISWLHDRKYFMPDRRLAIPIGVLTVAIVVTYFDVRMQGLAAWGAEIVMAALGISLVFILAKENRGRVIGCGIVGLAAVVLHFINGEVRSLQSVPSTTVYLPFTAYEFFFMFFLTTMIHVFVFTGAFILYGALKDKSRSGLLSFVVFLGCAVACVFVPLESVPSVSDYTKEAYRDTSETLGALMVYFSTDNAMTFEHLYHPGSTWIYESSAGVIAARVIAYAYTYHYLNWFSKTSVIKWHEVPRARWIVVVVAWVASLGLYAADYATGLQWLLLLSMLHVFLEFPLNWHSFIGIGRELMARARPG